MTAVRLPLRSTNPPQDGAPVGPDGGAPDDEPDGTCDADLGGLLDAVPVALIAVDLTGVVRHWNGVATQLFGWAAGDVLGRPLPRELRAARFGTGSPALLDRLLRAAAPPALRLRCRHRTGRVVEVAASLAPWRGHDGHLRGVVATVLDIGERLRAERDLRYQAHHDSLTHLPNKDMLMARLQRSLDTGARTRTNTGLLIIDLEKFKDVNDGLGRAAGDQLLAQVGPRLLSATARGGDLVARLSSDEFAVLLPGVESVPVAVEVAERMLGAFQTPFAVGGTRVDVAACIGVAVSPEHGTNAAQLVQHADAAMYEAKEAGADIAVYRPEIDDRAPTQFGLLGELRHALENRELVVHYQPKVDIATGTWAGSEALVRWQHPTRGLLAPGEFMPVVETTGLINRLTAHVLDEALAQTRRWMDLGVHVPVSVNLSARSLHDHTLPDRVLATLARHGVPVELLWLEITETAIMHDPEAALGVLDEFVRAGIGLSLDDFGTGYSSMSYLQRLPVTELKVDRTFVTGLVHTPADRALVRMAIDLGHSMGLQVVAEGVEDADTLRELRDLGCDIAQGYYLARPMPAAQLDTWHTARQRAAAIPAQVTRGPWLRTRRRQSVG